MCFILRHYRLSLRCCLPLMWRFSFHWCDLIVPKIAGCNISILIFLFDYEFRCDAIWCRLSPMWANYHLRHYSIWGWWFLRFRLFHFRCWLIFSSLGHEILIPPMFHRFHAWLTPFLIADDFFIIDYFHFLIMLSLIEIDCRWCRFLIAFFARCKYFLRLFRWFAVVFDYHYNITLITLLFFFHFLCHLFRLPLRRHFIIIIFTLLSRPFHAVHYFDIFADAAIIWSRGHFSKHFHYCSFDTKRCISLGDYDDEELYALHYFDIIIIIYTHTLINIIVRSFFRDDYCHAIMMLFRHFTPFFDAETLPLFFSFYIIIWWCHWFSPRGFDLMIKSLLARLDISFVDFIDAHYSSVQPILLMMPCRLIFFRRHYAFSIFHVGFQGFIFSADISNDWFSITFVISSLRFSSFLFVSRSRLFDIWYFLADDADDDVALWCKDISRRLPISCM